MYQYKTCGLNTVYLANGYDTAEFDGEIATSIHDIDGLHKAIGRNLAELSRALTGSEFRFLRVEMDMSQKALGLLLDKTDQSVANWEKSNNIPRTSDVTVRHLYLESIGENPLMKSFLEQFNAVDRSHQEEHMNFIESHEGWELNAA